MSDFQQLPPKRFQRDSDTKYDSIRHLPWFRTLAERRQKIAVLAEARNAFHCASITEAKAAELFGVDARELRDYRDFVSGRDRLLEMDSNTKRKLYQTVLDYSYTAYCANAGRMTLTEMIYQVAPTFGISARLVVELWECDAAFYPSQYRGSK